MTGIAGAAPVDWVLMERMKTVSPDRRHPHCPNLARAWRLVLQCGPHGHGKYDTDQHEWLHQGDGTDPQGERVQHQGAEGDAGRDDPDSLPCQMPQHGKHPMHRRGTVPAARCCNALEVAKLAADASPIATAAPVVPAPLNSTVVM